jgi:hypothetical protein
MHNWGLWPILVGGFTDNEGFTLFFLISNNEGFTLAKGRERGSGETMKEGFLFVQGKVTMEPKILGAYTNFRIFVELDSFRNFPL